MDLAGTFGSIWEMISEKMSVMALVHLCASIFWAGISTIHEKQLKFAFHLTGTFMYYLSTNV